MDNKQSKKFWLGLEKYLYHKITTSRIKWEWLALIGVGAVIGLSIVYGYGRSPTLSGDKEKIIEMAAELGDYQTAQTLYDNQTGVLGSKTELEEKVYPDRMMERKIAELETKLREYPENKEIYLMLANLYSQKGEAEVAEAYREKARVLDPNNEIFR